VCKAHRLLYHSTLGLRVIKKKKTRWKIRVAPSTSWSFLRANSSFPYEMRRVVQWFRGGLAFKAHRLLMAVGEEEEEGASGSSARIRLKIRVAPSTSWSFLRVRVRESE